MKQSRRMSVVESITNVVIGYCVAIATQLVIFPEVGIHVGLAAQAWIGAAFTVVSLVRSFLLRRVFEALRYRGIQ